MTAIQNQVTNKVNVYIFWREIILKILFICRAYFFYFLTHGRFEMSDFSFSIIKFLTIFSHS